MDAAVLAATLRWPNVPHVYGWLSLDRRGQWRLQGEPITNPHISEFISRNYASDARGAWFFQNGPQRVYVELDYTPWVVHLGEQGKLFTHNGELVQKAQVAMLDEAGNLLLAFAGNVGLIDDRDLAAMLDRICDAQGSPVDVELLAHIMAGEHLPVLLDMGTQRVPLQPIGTSDVATRFGFIADPKP